jgi:hypothetical protein
MMPDTKRGPRLLVPLATTDDSPQDIAAALYQELLEAYPTAAEGVTPTSIPYLSEALDQQAPDGWYFGVNDGYYGFWVADL